MMLRFSTRDLLWLTALVALALGWYLHWQSHRPTEKRLTGTITIASQPLDGGRIYFRAATGQIHGAPISAGAFEIDRLPFGEYRVTIEHENVPPYYNENSLVTHITKRTKTIQFGLHDKDHLARILARTSGPRPMP